jgi:hypothetical protein
MIIVICNEEYNEITDRYRLVVSHGLDSETLETVVLQPVHPAELGAEIHHEIGEFILL